MSQIHTVHKPVSSTGTPTPSLIIEITAAQNGWCNASSWIHRGNCIALSVNFWAGLDGWQILILDEALDMDLDGFSF